MKIKNIIKKICLIMIFVLVINIKSLHNLYQTYKSYNKYINLQEKYNILTKELNEIEEQIEKNVVLLKTETEWKMEIEELQQDLKNVNIEIEKYEKLLKEQENNIETIKKALTKN